MNHPQGELAVMRLLTPFGKGPQVKPLRCGCGAQTSACKLAGEMAPWLGTKRDDLNLIPETHWREGEPQLLQVVH